MEVLPLEEEAVAVRSEVVVVGRLTAAAVAEDLEEERMECDDTKGLLSSCYERTEIANKRVGQLTWSIPEWVLFLPASPSAH
jgi:hypothetical protein